MVLPKYIGSAVRIAYNGSHCPWLPCLMDVQNKSSIFKSDWLYGKCRSVKKTAFTWVKPKCTHANMNWKHTLHPHVAHVHIERSTHSRRVIYCSFCLLFANLWSILKSIMRIFVWITATKASSIYSNRCTKLANVRTATAIKLHRAIWKERTVLVSWYKTKLIE